MKTFSAKPKDISRQWYLIDASSMPLGRLSTIAASLLLGKGKPTVTPHIDGGDFVVIINSDKLKVSGDKEHKKDYYRHSGFPGGLYKRTLGEQAERDSTKIIRHAVRGMLPDNKLRKDRLARLKVYTDDQHSHAGQNPQIYGGNK
jgi:large subunit ribosomal protein L13